MSDFQSLVDELETLRKSRAPDETVTDCDDEIESVDEYEDDESGTDEPFQKSFAVTLEDGSEAMAFDGDSLIKSLQGEIAGVRGDLSQRMDQIHSALVTSTELLKSISDENIALRARVDKLSNSGSGRKSVLSVHEKISAAATPEPVSEVDIAKDVMAKATSAFDAGRISGRELNELSCAMRRREMPNANLLAKIS